MTCFAAKASPRQGSACVYELVVGIPLQFDPADDDFDRGGQKSQLHSL